MPDPVAGAPLLETACAFRPRILAERERIENGRRLPHDLAQELAAAGFFRIFVPEAYGGLDLEPMAALEVYEELARADASVAWCVWNGNTHWTTIQLAPEVAGAIHADPHVIIANSTRASGKAEVVDSGYRVTGRWALVSGCQLAAWMILLCTVHEDGKPRPLRSRRLRTDSCFARPRPARSSTPGRSAGCAVPAAMTWRCAIFLCQVPTRRRRRTRSCCQARAIGCH